LAYGVDGSSLTLPRTAANEAYFGSRGKKKAVPQLWVTAVMNLGSGVLHDWRFGPGRSGERGHLRRMLKRIPRGALLVGDAGFGGFKHLQRLRERGCFFLVRVCSGTQLLARVKNARDGRVFLWPTSHRGEAPLRLRLFELRERRGGERVCLVTNVLESGALTRSEAERLYELRWGLEVSVFRGLKQTLGKMKLLGEVPEVVIREAESALLCLMLCQGLGWISGRAGVVGSVGEAGRVVVGARYSLSGVLELLLVYGERFRCGKKGWDFWLRLRGAKLDGYVRRGPKSSRRPVKVKEHHPPRPPKILVMNEQLKAMVYRKLKECGQHYHFTA